MTVSLDRAARRRLARSGKSVSPITGIWSSNASWAPTGYGTQTKQVVSRMVADGHNVAVAVNYGLEGTTTEWEGITHFPRGFDQYSNDVVGAYLADWTRQFPSEREMLFTLYDVWVLKSAAFDTNPVVSWVPIDHSPVPPAVADFCAKDNVTPVAMSQFGSAQLDALGISNTYIPHAIDTSVMKPSALISNGSGQSRTSRQLMGNVDEARFVVGIVNANKGVSPNRKAFGEQLLAFSIFAQDKPDALLYLHTEKQPSMGGISFDTLIKNVGLRDNQYVFVNQYQNRMGIPDDVLACIYSGMDVLLAATYGEGFGITAIDAQACGVPVILNDFTASTELCGDGWLVQGQPLWDAAQSAWFSIPNVDGIVRALNEAYERKGSGPSSIARDFVVNNFDADAVYRDLWRPFLESL